MVVAGFLRGADQFDDLIQDFFGSYRGVAGVLYLRKRNFSFARHERIADAKSREAGEVSVGGP